jgi:hypothetical protein
MSTAPITASEGLLMAAALSELGEVILSPKLDAFRFEALEGALLRLRFFLFFIG